MTKLSTALLLALACHASLDAQSYSVEWYKMSSGGGASAGGPYGVSGTIGQSDAHNTLAGGQFTLNGGFWSIASVVQTPGAPELSLAVSSPGTVTISWPAPAPGFVLQQSAALESASWVNVASPVISTGTVKRVQVTISPGRSFFRLFHP